MKISEAWLREWVALARGGAELGEQLTMAGLEMDALDELPAPFRGVVVAEIREIQPHPNADRLRVCRVDAGSGELLQIVCGAANARAGLKAPLAKVGAELPGGFKISVGKLRGVESHGMLCAASELGLEDDAPGLLELPDEAVVGQPFEAFLELPDAVIDVNLTPNRGDCFSVLGVARELAALNGEPVTGPEAVDVPAVSDEVFPVTLAAGQACPRFAGRVVRGIDPQARTPLWMRERLRRCGIRSIHPVVDVTNYVMLELGQPLHGYDLALLRDGITVRFAAAGERLVLLDEREVELDADMLVIADASGAVGLAGIMGGLSTAVSERTVDVFFEAAHFAADAIAGRARRLGLHTDASLRFERGVDPQTPVRAVQRATELLLAIAGGAPGPLRLEGAEDFLADRAQVPLRAERLRRVLGVEIPAHEVEDIFARLGMPAEAVPGGWRVQPPSFRFDIAIEEDLIEEVARIHGYDRIPRRAEAATLTIQPSSETRVPLERVRDLLVARGYQEAITYSFVDEQLLEQFTPQETPLRLANPISAEMNAMRTSLWPGLLSAAVDNLSRQQSRVRLFEIGAEYHLSPDGTVAERAVIAGLAVGGVLPEQWGAPERRTDFFDVKGDLEAVLALRGRGEDVQFESAEHAGLHPGQTARVRSAGDAIGWLGTLHPRLSQRWDLSEPPVFFSLDVTSGLTAGVPRHRPISRFPAVRRDLALLVAESVPAAAILDTARAAAGELLVGLRVFDVFRGGKIESGIKSIALGLILQADSRTLTDHEVDAAIAAVVSALQNQLGAKIRD